MRRPALRIATLAWAIAAVAVAVALSVVPLEPTLRILHILVPAVSAVGFLVVAAVLWLGHRRR